MEVVEQNLKTGQKVQHKKTGVIRKIFVMENNETPSSVGILGKFNSVTDILLDTYLINKQFYTIIN